MSTTRGRDAAGPPFGPAPRRRTIDRRRSLSTLVALVRTVDPEGAGGPRSLVEPLRAALRAEEAGIVACERRGGALAIHSVHATPALAELFARLEAANRDGAPPPLPFDPFPPDPERQNVPLTLRELAPAGGAPIAAARASSGPAAFAGLDLLCALVCQGGDLLAWIGALRRRPFGARERAVLRALIPALRGRALVEHRLRTGEIARLGLSAALDALASAAFLVRRGAVLQANRAGRRLLEHDPDARAALADPAGTERFVRTPIPGELSSCCLAVERGGVAAPGDRLATAADRWGLTPRETEALSEIVRGAANKEVAAALGCAEATVERHVSAILAKSGAEHRAEVVARFWTGRWTGGVTGGREGAAPAGGERDEARRGRREGTTP